VKTARWLVIVGCVLSLGTALLHGVGYRSVSAEIGGTNAPAILVAAFKCIWLAFSVQFIVMSAIGVVALGSTRGKHVILLCSVMAIFDAGLMLYFIGPFFGVYCVAAVAVFLLAGGLLLPDAARS
jgi:hypothetical protein